MKKVEIALVYNYIYNQQLAYEQEVRQLQTNLRYRPVDVVDCSELSCAIERLNTFMTVTRQIMQLLKLVELDEEEIDEYMKEE